MDFIYVGSPCSSPGVPTYLCGEDVARGPSDLGAELEQGLDQDGGLKIEPCAKIMYCYIQRDGVQ